MDRTPTDSKPFYCITCGLGFGEFIACEEVDCELEDAWPVRKASEIEKIRRTVSYAQPTQLFANDGGGRFTPVTAAAGLCALQRRQRRQWKTVPLAMLAGGDERLRWGNPHFKLTTESDVEHLMAGHPIDLDCRVRYGLIAEPVE